MDEWNHDNFDPGEAPLADLAALWTARDPDELWRALVAHPGRSTTQHWEAVALFRRHHQDGSPEALTTAQLLCTDRRWHRCTARLIAGIAGASILGEDGLDELAGCFLWSDRFRFQYPVSWIGTEWVTIDLDGENEAAERSVEHLDPDTPVSSNRRIAPPLRRWATDRVLRADPGTFDAVRARALELEPRDGAAVVSGMLDATPALDEEVGRQAIDLGLEWRWGSVRLLALDLLAAHDPEAARARAAADPDTRVRAWMPPRPRDEVASSPRADPRPTTEERGHPAPRTAQATLFPE
ncbi:MAG TPA: hypothetical protein VEM93_03085 [Actinomycetota bacterium]|nr:hypothetical protein [Actinomycetota bacterium]